MKNHWTNWKREKIENARCSRPSPPPCRRHSYADSRPFRKLCTCVRRPPPVHPPTPRSTSSVVEERPVIPASMATVRGDRQLRQPIGQQPLYIRACTRGAYKRTGGAHIDGAIPNNTGDRTRPSRRRWVATPRLEATSSRRTLRDFARLPRRRVGNGRWSSRPSGDARLWSVAKDGHRSVR